jgi:hypothetical protein
LPSTRGLSTGSTWFRKSSPTSSCKLLGQGRWKEINSVQSAENDRGDYCVWSNKFCTKYWKCEKVVSFLLRQTAPMLNVVREPWSQGIIVARWCIE